MAIYDLANHAPANIVAGDIINCSYTGAGKNITLPPGIYQLEVWGAQGGTSNKAGGKGGYSKGNLTLTSQQNIYVYAGGQGEAKKGSSFGSQLVIAAGGFNGGGMSCGSTGSAIKCGGGGGSDIRIGTDSLYARVIVAGGGGGGTTNTTGGNGGGLSGSNKIVSTSRTIFGGGQNGGGIDNGNSSQRGGSGNFGIGGNGISDYSSQAYRGGGGGGGWYGGAAGGYVSGSDFPGGAGGSGYVYTESSSGNYPEGCLLNSSYYLSDSTTINGNAIQPDGTTANGHEGDGYCRITVIEVKLGTNCFIGNKKISKIYMGNKEIKHCFIGNKKIF